MRVATDEPNCRLTARGVPGMRNCFYQNSVLAVDVISMTFFLPKIRAQL